MASTVTCPQCEHEDRVMRVGSACSGGITGCLPVRHAGNRARAFRGTAGGYMRISIGGPCIVPRERRV